MVSDIDLALSQSSPRTVTQNSEQSKTLTCELPPSAPSIRAFPVFIRVRVMYLLFQASISRHFLCASDSGTVGTFFPMEFLVLCSAIVFQARSTSVGNCEMSLSTSFAWVWQSQIPLSGCRRCSDDSEGLYRGPPDAALVIWAATPTLRAFVGSSCGPLVKALQSGFEQIFPARAARYALLPL